MRYFAGIDIFYIFAATNVNIMAQTIIAREKEKKELQNLYHSGRPELVIIQGRRRVGKTFLVREMFANQFTFYHTGLSPFELEDSPLRLKDLQLDNFYSSLSRYGYVGPRPTNWIKAFDALINLLESKPDNDRQVVFIDELPWMDTTKSGFLTAFEHFWNGWGAGRENLMLIICGSSMSWINDKIINNKGGLFNRTSYEIKLYPLTLKECEDFYKDRDIIMDRYDQIQAYMITGGIPYYLSLLKRGQSLAKNIDDLCFDTDAKLKNEFTRLFKSIFSNSESCMKIVRLLGTKREGFSRVEISDNSKVPYGGGLSDALSALESSGFIASYIPYGGSSRSLKYKLVDPFCLFYLNFMDKKKTNNTRFWQDNLLSPSLNAWRGLAFENLCFKHIAQIKTALGISGVQSEVSPWRGNSEGEGAQIDMVIDRADRVINLCEMKYSSDDFRIDKSYDKDLRRKIDVFASDTKTRKTLHLTMVTPYGLAENEYSGRVQNVITMDNLFDGFSERKS